MARFSTRGDSYHGYPHFYARRIDLPALPRPAYSRDPDDDVFIYTGMHGKAEWLISDNKALLEHPPADWGFEILSPTQSLKRLNYLINPSELRLTLNVNEN